MKNESRRQLVRKAVAVTAFLIAFVVLTVWAARSTLTSRTIRHEVDQLKQKRDKLQAMADRMDSHAQQAEDAKRMALNVLRGCREAADIPHLNSEHVFAANRNGQSLRLHVPQGSHTLEITTAWAPSEKADASAKARGEPAPPVGEKTWRIGLLPDSGYWLELTSDRKGGPIRWELTSNNDEFEPRQETIPLDGFSKRGSSWSHFGAAVYPNQIERLSLSKPSFSDEPPGVKLMEAVLRGAHQGTPYEVTFDVRLASDGPACVSASDALRFFILDKEHLLAPYEGGGKYSIKPIK